uniref:Nucleophosmin/nucleoplasmin, 3 n=1 Tax=Neolamprologus brichardi TaxID=32507 RepID=A0A3Q4GYB8_NEOBR
MAATQCLWVIYLFFLILFFLSDLKCAICDARQAGLSIQKLEESNVVEVTAMNHQGKTISVPIANLHIKCLPMVSLGEFELKAPVTIRLKAGTGPVSVSGLHLIATQVEDSDLSEEEDGEEEEEEEELPAIKPAKKKQKQ